MPAEKKEIFEFGSFRLDVSEHRIDRLDGQRNGTLTEKAFQALVLLVRRQGHLVSKDELINHVWPDTIVEDNNLEKCIHYVRHFLGETPEGTTYIETVRKHGYRFVAPVNVLQVSGSWLPETASATDDPFTKVSSSGSLTGLRQDTVRERASDPAEQFAGSENRSSKSLLSGRSRRYLAYALAAIAVLMGAALFGSLNGAYFTWARTSQKPGTTNQEAYRQYQQAENLSARRNQENMPAAMDHLNQAVALDPDFARAWAAKALLHRSMADRPSGDQTEQYKRSMEAVEKALAIDPTLSEAHSAVCLNKLRFEYDTAGAESACLRSLEYDPGSPVGHKAYGIFLYSHGRHGEAIAQIKQALELQPFALEYQQAYALALYYARKYEEEEALWKSLIELNPTHKYLSTRLFINLKQQRRDNEAFDYLLKKFAVDQVDPITIEDFRTAYAASGWHGVTFQFIRHPETGSFTGPFDVACLYAGIGDRDKAFAHLEEAFRQRSHRMAVLQVEPQLDPLRDDPRYVDLVRRFENGN